MRNADSDELIEQYDKGYDAGREDGYADAMLAVSSEHHVTAVARVRVALNDILNEKMNYNLMEGYEIHENDGRRELARTLLATISDALEGRP